MTPEEHLTLSFEIASSAVPTMARPAGRQEGFTLALLHAQWATAKLLATASVR
jgi:hypothetical protein